MTRGSLVLGVFTRTRGSRPEGTRYLVLVFFLKDYKGGCEKIIKGYKGINFLYFLIFF